MPIGSTRLIDGYVYRKVSDVPNVPYTSTGSPSTTGLDRGARADPARAQAAVRNGDRFDIRLDNLELVTPGAMMARNSVHNLPPPLKQTIQLLGALNRQIRKRDPMPAKNKIDDLRDHLFETLEALKDDEKPMDIDRAKAIADVARVIVDSAKVEVDFLKVSGAIKSTDFLPDADEAKPAARAAVAPRDLGCGHAGTAETGDRSRGEHVLRVLRVARALRTGATIDDLARELQCTRRTIYRDVELLQELHAPIETARGRLLRDDRADSRFSEDRVDG
jgi:hypothetical protein